MLKAQPVRGYETVVGVVSLIVGPLLMSIGDLMHPEEKMDAGAQAAVIAAHASRWYAAHLLIFIGMVIFIPGMLALTSLTAERKPTAGYASRVLLMIGAASLASIFAGEMLVGRYAMDGADAAAIGGVLDSSQSGPVLGVVLMGGVAFFVGVGTLAIPLAIDGGFHRWPAIFLMAGSLLIVIEIISAKVIFSQIGNVVILVATTAFAAEIFNSGGSAQRRVE